MDLSQVKTPCYLLELEKLEHNLKLLAEVRNRAGCKILLAQKAFSMFSVYPLVSSYLDGAASSGLFEAKLAHEHFDGENHVYSPAFREGEIDKLLPIVDHIVFNSISQWEKFKEKVAKAPRKISVGLRINPECSTQDHAIYDPCSPYSRLGITIRNFPKTFPEGIDGLHFHTLCEQNCDDLAVTLLSVEKKFGPYLKHLKWINFGGGHHITREDYDREGLIRLIHGFKKKYNNIEVYLEPGEAIALNAGVLVTSVLALEKNEKNIAILDASAACHMPDVLEMPYRPRIQGAGMPEEKNHTYRLGGATCLAGDIIGEYSFDEPLKEGDKLVFEDMAIYTMVKNNTFNGQPLPSIAIYHPDNTVKTVREFTYEDFKMRLS